MRNTSRFDNPQNGNAVEHMSIVRNEIGSEFWDAPVSLEEHEADRVTGDKRFYLSGRTALYAVIEDILASRECRTAYLPSYCCHSMVDPFFRHRIAVQYYPVVLDRGFRADIDVHHHCDMILTTDYFGFAGKSYDLPNAIHIHDETHSFLSQPAYANSDYTFASMRKWGAVAGAAFACKRKSSFDTPRSKSLNSAYTAMRSKGYALKAQYMNGSVSDKAVFLGLFSDAESLLERDYTGYAADEKSIIAASGLSRSKWQRRENAGHLLDGLVGSRLVTPIFSTLEATSVPLFVPVIVGRGLRDELRAYLIEKDMYCPVHWPIPNQNKIGRQEQEIYDNELSLICDQRYGREHMQRQVDLIREFENHNA